MAFVQLLLVFMEVLYLYEPCRARGSGLMGTYGGELLRAECFALVQRICRCEFTLEDSDRLAQDGSALKAGSPVLSELRRAAVDGTPTVDALIQAHEAVTDACKKSKAVVIKSIRLRDGLNGPDCEASGLKLLHLVRDPRAVVRSQLETFGNKAANKYDPEWHGGGDLSSEAADERAYHVLGKQICKVYSQQLDMSSTLSDDRYLLVRYEDLATLPKVEVDLVYRWSGLGKTPPSITSWLDMNTKMSDCDAPTEHGARRLAWTVENNLGGADARKNAYYSWLNARHQKGAGRTLQSSDSVNNHDDGEGGEESREDGVSGGGDGGGGDGGGSDDGDGVGDARGEGCASLKRSQNRPFSTQRHSADMVDQWRTQMPREYAEAVWEECAGSNVMADLGYEY